MNRLFSVLIFSVIVLIAASVALRADTWAEIWQARTEEEKTCVLAGYSFGILAMAEEDKISSGELEYYLIPPVAIFIRAAQAYLDGFYSDLALDVPFHIALISFTRYWHSRKRQAEEEALYESSL